jgi:hypothetical protein
VKEVTEKVENIKVIQISQASVLDVSPTKTERRIYPIEVQQEDWREKQEGSSRAGL